jgi:hypothetical protein
MGGATAEVRILATEAFCGCGERITLVLDVMVSVSLVSREWEEKRFDLLVVLARGIS